MGGYLGVMAKLGPFYRRDSCSLVRGVLERLITPFVHVAGTCMAGAFLIFYLLV